MKATCDSSKLGGINPLSLKNPSIYLSIILSVLFFISLLKPLSSIYLGPFAVMTWLSFFMCIGAPILIGGLFIALQPKWDAGYTDGRKLGKAKDGKE
jgi:hypothetical protein